MLRLWDDRVAGARLRVRTEGGGERPDQVPPANHLTEGDLHAAEVIRAVGSDALGKQAGHEVQFDAEAGARLQVVAAKKAGGAVKCVRLLDIAIDEDVLPGNERVIEEEHRVILVKAAGQGVI